MIFFQQYGARRTGTNYLQALVEYNFNDVLLLSTFHWKHGHRKSHNEMIKRVYPQYPDTDVVSLHCYKGICGKNDDMFEYLSNAVIDDKIKTIVSVKDPYAWIESVWRWSANTKEKNVEEYGYIDLNKGYEMLNYQPEILKFTLLMTDILTGVQSMMRLFHMSSCCLKNQNGYNILVRNITYR